MLKLNVGLTERGIDTWHIADIHFLTGGARGETSKKKKESGCQFVSMGMSYREECRMLVLSRKVGEAIQIGPDIRIVLVEAGTHQIKLGISAPVQIKILRTELLSADRGN